MIITLLIFIALAGLVHKFVMGAVENYTYDNTVERYENRTNHMYWDVIKKQSNMN
jgi:hypothetical protein